MQGCKVARMPGWMDEHTARSVVWILKQSEATQRNATQGKARQGNAPQGKTRQGCEGDRCMDVYMLPAEVVRAVGE